MGYVECTSCDSAQEEIGNLISEIHDLENENTRLTKHNQILRGALEDILSADATSTVAGAVAIAQTTLNEVGVS